MARTEFGKDRGPALTVEGLETARIREQWTAVTGSPPPRYASRMLLSRMLADRLQTNAHGGVSARLKRRLLAIAAAARSKGDIKPARQRRCLTRGTTLVRDWKGTRHQVLVTISGFTYDQQTYRSLSEIARKITGTRWSGPAFFGLTRASKPKARP